MKRFISITVSMIILSIIYSKIDLQALADIFLNSHRFWMPVSLAMVIPITLFTAWRLQQLMPKSTYLGFWEANRLILAASVLNMVLPSKMFVHCCPRFLQLCDFFSDSFRSNFL